jgi:hypothetical protein
LSRLPSIVSTHLKRKRVSNENSPMGSAGDASISPVSASSADR